MNIALSYLAGMITAFGIVAIYKQLFKETPIETPEMWKASCHKAEIPLMALHDAEIKATEARNGIKDIQLEKKDLTPQEIQAFFNRPSDK